jgi:hypothetical protein
VRKDLEKLCQFAEVSGAKSDFCANEINHLAATKTAADPAAAAGL